MKVERRKSVRIKKAIFVQYRETSGKESKWDATLVKDISTTGIQITTNGYFPADTGLTFRFRLPSEPGQLLEVSGDVVDSKKLVSDGSNYLAGTFITRIKFTQLTAQEKELLKGFIRWFLDHGEGRK